LQARQAFARLWCQLNLGWRSDIDGHLNWPDEDDED